MSRRRSLLIALPVVVLLLAAGAAAAAWFARPKKVAVTVEVSGTPGLTVKGTAEVDGNTQELTGTVPTKFVLEGSRMTFSLTTPADEGEFRVKTILGGKALAPGGSGSPPKNGVRGWVKSGWGWSPPEFWTEPFDKDAKPAWMTPPPP